MQGIEPLSLALLVIFFLLIAFSISCSTVEEKPQDSGYTEEFDFRGDGFDC